MSRLMLNQTALLLIDHQRTMTGLMPADRRAAMDHHLKILIKIARLERYTPTP